MIAYGRDSNAIAQSLGADYIVFQTLSDLKQACPEATQDSGHERPHAFEVGVFCGQYVTPVSLGYLDRLETIRGPSSKVKNLHHASDAPVLAI